MQYREFGNLGFEISAFGLGCMRLPLQTVPNQASDPSKINEQEAIELIRYAIDHGVNYVDTAYPYHGGNSELVVAKALKDGYREKVKLATKLPVWFANSYEDFDKYLDEQLAKLEVDYIDFYLLHALNKSTWPKIKALGVLEFLDKAVASGKIRYPSFSFHDERPLFKEIVDAYDWKMCQIQLNILDEDYQAGLEGMHYAAERGIPVVIMEPLKGGSLARSIPQDIQEIWGEAAVSRSPVDWAFRWLGNFPEVNVMLSGVNNLEQLKDNLRIFETIVPNELSQEELKLVTRVKEAYNSKIKVGCTRCNYCVPCPAGVAIPDVFLHYNNASIYNALEENKSNYQKLVRGNKDASHCVECGSCEEACPQSIPIIEKLAEADLVLAGR
ncbi:MAG: NADP-dependent oxidoreductase domain protein [Paenibacillaceae bacterium]|jgi:predicted aldo/keto reductase-like oxidoreductase|nr:NADP-dependent oxidoreductase domain protein [Paenibacillaceae bacterium]